MVCKTLWSFQYSLKVRMSWSIILPLWFAYCPHLKAFYYLFILFCLLFVIWSWSVKPITSWRMPLACQQMKWARFVHHLMSTFYTIISVFMFSILVSVHFPTYRWEEFLKPTIQSFFSMWSFPLNLVTLICDSELIM